jgi:hypothetical protein
MGIEIFPLVAGYDSAKLCSYDSAKLGSYYSASRPNGPARRGVPRLNYRIELQHNKTI